MEHPTCAECAFWERPEGLEWDPVRSIMGNCTRTPHASDTTHWIDQDGDTVRAILPEYIDRTASTTDASDYASHLLTKAEHYCRMHSTLAAALAALRDDPSIATLKDPQGPKTGLPKVLWSGPFRIF